MARTVVSILAIPPMLSLAALVPASAGATESMSLNFEKLDIPITKGSKKPQAKASKHKGEVPIESYGWTKPKPGAAQRKRLRSR